MRPTVEMHCPETTKTDHPFHYFPGLLWNQMSNTATHLAVLFMFSRYPCNQWKCFPSGQNDQELEFSVSLTPTCHISSVDSFNTNRHGNPQFHCIFDDKFETVCNEQQDTSIWQKKAHLPKTKETILSPLHHDKLVTAHTQSPSLVLPRYGVNVPNALMHLTNELKPITKPVQQRTKSLSKQQQKTKPTNLFLLLRNEPNHPFQLILLELGKQE